MLCCLDRCQQHIDFTAGQTGEFGKRFLRYIPFVRVGAFAKAMAVPEDFSDAFICRQLHKEGEQCICQGEGGRSGNS